MTQPQMSERAWQTQVLELATLYRWQVLARPPEMATENPPLEASPEELPAGLGDQLVGSDVCALTLDGEPTTKARPRFAKGRTFTDSKTVEAEEAIASSTGGPHDDPRDPSRLGRLGRAGHRPDAA